MRQFLFVFGLVVAASPAFAQNTITVIQEDGSKVTIELEDPGYVLPGEELQPQPAPAPAPIPEQKPDVVPEVATQPYVDEIVAPTGEDKPALKVIKEIPKKKESKKEKQKHPTPPRPPQQKAVQQDLPPGAEITERMATSIAFDHAPPSSDFSTVRQQYQGKDVYVVTFQTENGPFDVLVDTMTGAVLVAAYVETHQTQPTPPGHLPQDWKPYEPQRAEPSSIRGNVVTEDN